MSVKVRVEKSPLKVKVGQTDAIKILSTGAAAPTTVKNVVGGIADVTALNVAGISTLGGDVSIQGSLQVENLGFDNLSLTNLNISGIATANVLNVTGTLTAGLIDGGSFWWQNQVLDKDLLTTVSEN